MTAFSVPQLAARWCCSAGHIRNLIDRGEVRAFQLGRLIRIPASEVERVECSQNTASSASGVGSRSSGQTQPESATADSLPRGIDLGPRLRHDAELQPGEVLPGRWAI
jgi:excisionase family DNA binding protein